MKKLLVFDQPPGVNLTPCFSMVQYSVTTSLGDFRAGVADCKDVDAAARKTRLTNTGAFIDLIPRQKQFVSRKISSSAYRWPSNIGLSRPTNVRPAPPCKSKTTTSFSPSCSHGPGT